MPYSFQSPTVLALARRKKLRRAGLFAQACIPMVQGITDNTNITGNIVNNRK